jgi:hypothetical protein
VSETVLWVLLLAPRPRSCRQELPASAVARSRQELPASAVARSRPRNTAQEQSLPSPAWCCRALDLTTTARALSFARSLLCPLSERSSPLLSLLSLLHASRSPSPWPAPPCRSSLTADCTYGLYVLPAVCTGEASSHPSGLLTPPSSPGSPVWMAQGIILPLSSSRGLRLQTHGQTGSSLVSQACR